MKKKIIRNMIMGKRPFHIKVHSEELEIHLSQKSLMGLSLDLPLLCRAVVRDRSSLHPVISDSTFLCYPTSPILMSTRMDKPATKSQSKLVQLQFSCPCFLITILIRMESYEKEKKQPEQWNEKQHQSYYMLQFYSHPTYQHPCCN